MYDKAAQLTVSVGFNRMPYTGFANRVNEHDLHVWFQVSTMTSVRVRGEELHCIHFAGGALKSYYLDPFSGRCVSTRFETCAQTGAVKFNGCWQILLKGNEAGEGEEGGDDTMTSVTNFFP